MTRKFFMKWSNAHLLSKMRYLATILFWLLISFFVAAYIGAYVGSKWYESFVKITNFVIHDHWTLSVIIISVIWVLYPCILQFIKRKRFAINHNDDKKLKDLKMLVSNHQDIKSCSLSEHPFLEGLESYLKEHASENV